jgi:hypothetical protein
VAHKGFPKARDVIETIMEICKVSHNDLQRGLTVWQQADFLTYIRGKNNSVQFCIYLYDYSTAQRRDMLKTESSKFVMMA